MLMSPQLHCLFILYLLLIQAALPSHQSTTMLSKIVCFGQRLTLVCRTGTSLEIQGADIKTSRSLSECRKYRRRRPGCESPGKVTEVIQAMCDGKDECSLGYGSPSRSTSKFDCHARAMYFKNTYFNISYKCSASSVAPSPPVDKSAMGEEGDSLYFTLLRLFIDMQSAGDYIATHSLWFILCIASSFCIGVLVLIIYALLFKFFCNVKNYRPHTSPPTGNGARGGPVEIIHPASPATQSDHTEELVVSSHTDSSSFRNSSSNVQTTQTQNPSSLLYQISGTSRVSVDEQTQTSSNIVQEEPSTTKRKLTATEMEELGSLVADLNHYDMMMDDPFELVDGPMSRKSGDYDNIGDIYHNSRDVFRKSSNNSTMERNYLKYDKYVNPFPTSKDGTLQRNAVLDTSGSLQSQARARRVSDSSSFERGLYVDVCKGGSQNTSCSTPRNDKISNDNIPIYATLNYKGKSIASTAPLTESIGTLNRDYTTRIRSNDIGYMFGNEGKKKPTSSSTLQREPSNSLYREHETFHYNKPQSEPSSTPRIESRRFSPHGTSNNLSCNKDGNDSLRMIGIYPTQKLFDNRSSCTSHDDTYSEKSSRKCSRSPPRESFIQFPLEGAGKSTRVPDNNRISLHSNGTTSRNNRTTSSSSGTHGGSESRRTHRLTNDHSTHYQSLISSHRSPSIGSKNNYHGTEFQRSDPVTSSISSHRTPFPHTTSFGTTAPLHGITHTNTTQLKHFNGTPESQRRMSPITTGRSDMSLTDHGSVGNEWRYTTNGNSRHELRRQPSELSYETGTSGGDENNMRDISSTPSSPYMGRNPSSSSSVPGKFKLGVRGDGFDYIVGNVRPK